jgi:hypothetical protein
MGNIDRVPLKVGGSAEPRVLKIGRSTTEGKLQTQWDKTEATRYLCASSYLSRAFRNSVIRTLVDDKHRALAVSYGVDPVTVLKHCLAARHIGRTRDLLLLIPAMFLLFAFLSSVVAGPSALLLSPVLFFVAMAAAFVIIAWEQWECEFNIVRQNFTRKHFDPAALPRSIDRDSEQVFREVEAAQKSNVMIYAAFSPFVGCGNNIGSWSIPVDVSKGKENVTGHHQPESFEIKDLYGEISRTLRSLDFPNCQIEDKVCISGLDIRGEEQFLPDLMGRPRTRVEPSVIEQYVNTPSGQARHYQTFRIVDWSGELILSVFLRAARTGHNLFVEVSYCLLVPVDEAHRRVDAMNPIPGWRDWFRLLSASAIKAVFVWLAWPFYMLELIFRPLLSWLHEREARNMIRENPAFNHGAATSLREMTCTANLYRRYFQKLDKEMYMKILEAQILDCVVRFLDERNIDTSGLKEAQNRIINSGIIVAGGGSVEANTLAVGRGSVAVGDAQTGKGAIKFIQGLTRKVAGGER